MVGRRGPGEGEAGEGGAEEVQGAGRERGRGRWKAILVLLCFGGQWAASDRGKDAKTLRRR